MDRLIDARWSALWLAGALLVAYCLTPLAAHEFLLRNPYSLQLAMIAGLAAICIVCGFYINGLDRRFSPGAWRVTVPAHWFQLTIWGAFLAFLTVTILTAPSIPLLSALAGGDRISLDLGRARALKVREGWMAALPYVNTFLTGAIVPFALAHLFVTGSRWRYPALALMILYSVLFLIKAQIVFTAAPLLYVAITRRNWRLATMVVAIAIGAVVASGYLTRVVPAPNTATTEVASPGSIEPGLPAAETASRAPEAQKASYFAADYAATGTLDFLVWRAFAVPIFTAADALRVFDEWYDGQPFYGRTSTLIAKLTGRERVNFEADVYAFQWGRSDIGRSNAAYFVGAFTNFGIIGVILASIFVGQSLRWLRLSPEAARAIWPLYAYMLYSADLTPTLLSAGYAVFFAFVLFVRLAPAQGAAELSPQGGVTIAQS